MKNFIKSCMGFQGRIGRKAYLIRKIVLYAVLVIVYALPLTMILKYLQANHPSGLPGSQFPSQLFYLLAIFGVVVILGSAIIDIMLDVRRFHDFGLSGWCVLGWMLLTAVVVTLLGELLGLIVQVSPFLIPGAKGPNEYGADPSAADQ